MDPKTGLPFSSSAGPNLSLSNLGTSTLVEMEKRQLERMKIKREKELDQKVDSILREIDMKRQGQAKLEIQQENQRQRREAAERQKEQHQEELKKAEAIRIERAMRNTQEILEKTRARELSKEQKKLEREMEIKQKREMEKYERELKNEKQRENLEKTKIKLMEERDAMLEEMKKKMLRKNEKRIELMNERKREMDEQAREKLEKLIQKQEKVKEENRKLREQRQQLFDEKQEQTQKKRKKYEEEREAKIEKAKEATKAKEEKMLQAIHRSQEEIMARGLKINQKLAENEERRKKLEEKERKARELQLEEEKAIEEQRKQKKIMADLEWQKKSAMIDAKYHEKLAKLEKQRESMENFLLEKSTGDQLARIDKKMKVEHNLGAQEYQKELMMRKMEKESEKINKIKSEKNQLLKDRKELRGKLLVEKHTLIENFDKIFYDMSDPKSLISFIESGSKEAVGNDEEAAKKKRKEFYNEKGEFDIRKVDKKALIRRIMEEIDNQKELEKVKDLKRKEQREIRMRIKQEQEEALRKELYRSISQQKHGLKDLKGKENSSMGMENSTSKKKEEDGLKKSVSQPKSSLFDFGSDMDFK